MSLTWMEHSISYRFRAMIPMPGVGWKSNACESPSRLPHTLVEREEEAVKIHWDDVFKGFLLGLLVMAVVCVVKG